MSVCVGFLEKICIKLKTQEQQIRVTENALLGETSSQQISDLVAWKLMIVIV